MAVAVVMPVEFCAKAIEKCNKNTKISCLLEIISFIMMSCKIYCNSYIPNCSVAQAQVVARLEPKPLRPTDPALLEDCNPIMLVFVLMLVLVGQSSAGACSSEKSVLLAFFLSICHLQNYEEKHGEMMM